jgi:hypothetical protein
MRILVATTFTIPAFSGGWTTPLDLFGNEHQSMYVVRNHKLGTRVVEGIKCVGTGAVGGFSRPWKISEKYRHAFVQRLFRNALKQNFQSFKADFVLCLDPEAGFAAMHSGLPYAMRFHSQLSPEDRKPPFDDLMRNALFAVSCPQTNVPDTIVVPHNQDLSRFTYRESPKAEKALLLTSIDSIHEPELFIEGVVLSKKMKGDIVGTGEDRKKIAKLCSRTSGKVRCLSPVPRLSVPELLGSYQIGVATVKKVSPIIYQMKVNAYMASGLYTLAKPWTHIVSEAPDLVSSFVTAREMADCLDYLSENWSETLTARRKAREWINEHYSVEIPRKIFREILDNTFSP